MSDLLTFFVSCRGKVGTRHSRAGSQLSPSVGLSGGPGLLLSSREPCYFSKTRGQQSFLQFCLPSIFCGAKVRLKAVKSGCILLCCSPATFFFFMNRRTNNTVAAQWVSSIWVCCFDLGQTKGCLGIL